MKKIISVTVSIFTILCLALLVVMPKQEFSEKENRYLAQFPSFTFDALKDGSYTENMNSFFDDHFPFRDIFVGLKTEFEKNVMRKKDINGVYISSDGYMIEKYESVKDTQHIAETFNKFCESVGERNVCVMLVPTAFDILGDKLPAHTSTDGQSMDMQKIFDGISAKNAIKVNPTAALKDKKSDVDLYYRLDHHWTSEGAYIGYEEFCKAMGLTPSPLESFNKKIVADDFYGTIYSKLNDYAVKGDSITAYSKDYELEFKADNKVSDSIFNEEYLSQKDKYSYFLDNIHPFIEIDKKSGNEGKSIAVIKDSYANCMVPFLLENYDKIYVFDTRYYRESASEFINENNVDDVLILYNMNTIGTDMGVNNIK